MDKVRQQKVVGEMSNKSNGTAFEKEFAGLLAEHGFWAHILKDNENGQPFDVIAAKDCTALVFDCKDCKGNGFYLRRMEDNQISAMKLWHDCGNVEGIFAVRYQDGAVFLFCISDLEAAKEDGVRYISREHAKYYGARFEAWMERVGRHESDDQQ